MRFINNSMKSNYSKNKKIGDKGEELVRKYAEEKLNFTFVDKNVKFNKFGSGEIDLIFKDKNFLVFAEVKTRKDESFVDILESIGERKIRAMKRAGTYYIYQNNLHDLPCRIDVFTLNKKTKEIKHYKDILN